MTAVSVIIPAWRAEPFIGRAVRSVLAQTRCDWELIIISDDGQDYAEILKAQGVADPRLRFVSTGRDGAGPSAARNAGLDAARGDIVASLDADDAYSANFLAEMIPAAQKHGAAHAAIRMIQQEIGVHVPPVAIPAPGSFFTLPTMMRYCLGYANIVFDRRRCSVRWPEGMQYGEDLMFWALLLDILPRGIAYVDAARYDCYQREGSLSRPPASKSTHEICNQREKLLAWLRGEPPPVKNAANRAFLIRWFQTANDIEHLFNYAIVDSDTYMKVMKQHFGDALPFAEL